MALTKCSRVDANILQTCATLHHQLQRSYELAIDHAHSLWRKLLLAGQPPKIELSPGKPYAIRNGQFDILDSRRFPIEPQSSPF